MFEDDEEDEDEEEDEDVSPDEDEPPTEDGDDGPGDDEGPGEDGTGTIKRSSARAAHTKQPMAAKITPVRVRRLEAKDNMERIGD